MNEWLTTEEAAAELNRTERKLLNLVRKYPHLRPDTFGSELVWTPAKIEAVREHERRVAEGLCWKCAAAMDAAPPAEEPAPEAE